MDSSTRRLWRTVTLSALLLGAGALAGTPVGRTAPLMLPPTSLVQGLQVNRLTDVDPEIQELLEEPGQGRPRLELTVLDAVETALRHNLDVQVERFDQESSRDAIMAQRARFDPTLTFRVPQSFQRSSRVTTDQIEGADILTTESFGGGFSFSETLEWGTTWSVNWTAGRTVTNSALQRINPSVDSSLRFNVTQPLLQGFGSVNRAPIVVAQNNYARSREAFRGQVQSRIQLVYNAYWDLQTAIRQLQVDQESLQLALQQHERSLIQVEIAALAPVETVQTRRQVSSARLRVVGARNDVESSLDELKELLNLEAVRDDWDELFVVPVDEPEETVGEIDVDEAVAVALENDPNLRQLRIGLDNSRLDLEQSRDELLPSVDLSLDVGLSGQGGDEIVRSATLGGAVLDVVEGGFGDAVGQLFSGDFRNWSVGLSVVLPLHNWAARSRHGQAIVGERQQLAELRRRERQIVFDVREAVRDLGNLVEQVEVAREAAELARLQLEAEQLKFQVGDSSNFQVLDFQNDLNGARAQELQAVTALARARVQLELAKGTVLEFFGVSIQEAGRGGRR